MAKVEIACFNVNAALIAQENGANRIEFCADMHLGGTTPSLLQTRELRDKIHIDLNVMIRPRGGDFAYSEAEFGEMKQQINAFKELGVDGFVFGILDADRGVNSVQNTELVALAHPIPCTFHRAFDEVADMHAALESVIAADFKTILTSGCRPNVDLGLANLKELVSLAADRIVIMPGGGLRSSNLAHILSETHAHFVHSSAITDGGDTAVAEEVESLVSIK